MKRIFLVAVLLVGASLAALAQRREEPSGPANPFQGNQQAIQRGKNIYDQTCTQCHGPAGAAGEIGPALVSAEHPDARGSDAQTFNIIKNGIPGTFMPAHGAKLSDEEIWKIAAYIHALRGTAVDAPSPGNAAHGQQIYWKKGQCGTCHMINGRGGFIGPDLSNIAGIRKTNSIIDALTKARHHVYGDGGSIPRTMMPMDTYQPVRVTTADGQTIDGVLKNEDNYALQVLGSDDNLYSFDRTKVQVVYEPKSLMPTDYDKRLTPDEFRDLLAFLTHQGSAPAPGRAR